MKLEEKIKEIYSTSVVSSLSDELFNEIAVYLKSNPGAAIYHHPLWLKILAEETAQKYLYIIFREKGKIRGLLPLLFTRGIPFVNSPLSSRRISSLPRTPYAGILSDSDLAFCKITEEVKKVSSEYPGNLVQIKSDRDYNIIDKDFSSAEWRSNYVKRIPSASEDLSFDSKKDEKDIFRAIKRAKERNVFIKKGETLEELKAWYNMYLYIMRQNRIPPRKFSFFENIWKFLYPAGLLDINYAVVNNSGKQVIINGTINFKFNNKYFGGFKAGNHEYASYMGGDFLIYTEMLELKEKGFISYDLGEVSVSNKKLDKYKTKWGVDTFKIYHNYYGNIDRNVLTNLDSEPGNGIITQIWKKLPLGVTAKIGGAVNYYL